MSGTLKIAGTTLATNPTNSKVEIDDAVSGKGICKAWVNFNGTITGTQVGSDEHFTTANNGIRAAYNVDYIIDQGQGTYQVHFENALADANYAITQIYKPDNTASGANARMLFLDSQSAVSFNVITVAMGGSATDYPIISFAIFGS